MGICEYIDPDQPNTSPPEEPEIPTLEGIDKKSDKELLDLTFQAELVNYQAKLKDWNNYEESYQKLCFIILTSIAPRHLYLIEDIKDLRQVIIKLKIRFQKPKRIDAITLRRIGSSLGEDGLGIVQWSSGLINGLKPIRKEILEVIATSRIRRIELKISYEQSDQL
ncbi:hypothetical protein PHISCL_00718 [Aspergillus sclerotialis]|uniref:Uncharacterized protein n=1 Tax=Aspergillus sclerotialis TaxID=2070753 RepID=A0A3A3AC62_9EURO|nr:hypothetical protein PHISCL_00718 [Aspergillus sclerotialis]